MSEQAVEITPRLEDVGVEEAAVPEVGRMSLWQLTWRRFLRNRLAVGGGIVLIILYILVILADFLSPYDHLTIWEDYIFLPPQWPRFIDNEGNFHLRPFVYGVETTLDMERLEWIHKPDYDKKYPIYFFVHGRPYKLFGLIETDIHLFGVEEPGTIFLLGTDRVGRDMLARILKGGRVSLTVGLVGVSLTIFFGSALGTASGYFGGMTDTIMQRIIELLMSFPTIPLWAALAAALPPDWSTVKRYFAISLILSLVGWTGLARQVRAKVLAYREMDYTSAARAAGASDWRIIFVHMLPNALSHIIVVATLSIPGMILAETALSFLGLGIQPPMVSWGVLLQDAQTVSVVVQHPWLMIPGIFVIIAVLCFNFVGDGLRDAADPFAI
ncbi:MAG TPA: ABC transporter permease [Caldilineae bacterium]|nr:ABC transporter permease [Caldilineae bacterium]